MKTSLTSLWRLHREFVAADWWVYRTWSRRGHVEQTISHWPQPLTRHSLLVLVLQWSQWTSSKIEDSVVIQLAFEHIFIKNFILTKSVSFCWIYNIDECIHCTAASPYCWFEFHNLFSVFWDYFNQTVIFQPFTSCLSDFWWSRI